MKSIAVGLSAIVALMATAGASSPSAKMVFDSHVLTDRITKVHIVRDETSPNGIKSIHGGADLEAPPNSIATATYDNSINATGWGYLDVVASEGYDNNILAYAAGFAEGAAMARTTDGHNIIYPYVQNNDYWGDFNPKLAAYFDTQMEYQKQQQAVNSGDVYWHHVSLVNQQLQGLYDGYNMYASADQQLNFSAFMNIQAQGDLYDLYNVPALQDPDFPSKAPNGVTDRLNHCSGLVRLLPNNSDILTSHATWSNLEGMTRVFKKYTLPYTMSENNSTLVPAVTVTFSSYPGCLDSTDDFYQTDRFVIFETTIDNNNVTLYEDYVYPESVLDFTRNIIANRLATSGPHWAELFSLQNSGTYNNEFVVVDTALFTPGQPLLPNTVIVLDQMPGYISWADQSELVQSQGYFSSYNVPFYPEIFDVSNTTALVEEYGGFSGPGAYYSWNATARHVLFAQMAPQVTNLEEMKTLMRFNEYQTTPISHQGCASNPPYSAIMAIAARMDLNPPTGDSLVPGVCLQGDLACIDGKIASAVDVKNGLFVTYAQSGPSYDNQPVFSFSNTTLPGISWIDMPDVWHFPWVNISFP